MAHSLQTITPTAAIQSFQGAQTELTYLPRSRIIFSGKATITAKNAADSKTVQIDMTLPQNFAYVMDSGFVSFYSGSAAGALNYSNLGSLELQWSTGTADEPDVIEQIESKGEIGFEQSGTGALKTWNRVHQFSEVMYNQSGAAVVANVGLYDTDAAGTPALTCKYYYSFLQYDIRQVTQVPVNAPTPVSVR